MKRKFNKVMRTVLSMQLIALFLMGNSVVFAQNTVDEDIINDENFEETPQSDEHEGVQDKKQTKETNLDNKVVYTANRADEPVRIKGTSTTYSTLKEAIDSITGTTPITLEITDNMVETPNTDIFVNANITLEAVGGNFGVTMKNGSINVQNGNTLILGDGAGANILTLNSNRAVLDITNGHIVLRDGVELISTYDAIQLTGNNARGSILGGFVKSDSIAIKANGGAQITNISGGEFFGEISSVRISDLGSKIDLISGGKFENGTSNPLSRSNFYVENNAQVGEISGGEFLARSYSAVQLMRGGWIDIISGGSFISEYQSPTNMEGRGLNVISINDKPTGVGEISGGSFSGQVGVLIMDKNTSIETISGGNFFGKVGLQVDLDAEVGSIANANFDGAYYGLMNVSKIKDIGEGTKISGSIGIWNYGTNSQIKTISGGSIQSSESSAIKNEGIIDLISGGTFIGETYAVDSSSLNSTPKKIGVISGGNFYGKEKETFRLSVEVKLEPSIDTVPGIGRYWGRDGKIFNDESLVVYPDSYYMSSLTKDVYGVSSTEFKYLTKSFEIKYVANGGSGNMQSTSTEYYVETTISENDFINNTQFLGWNTQADGKGVTYAEGEEVLLENNLILYAQWKTDNPTKPIIPDEVQKPSISPETTDKKQVVNKEIRSASVQTGDITASVILMSFIGIGMSVAYIAFMLKKRKN